MDENKLQSANYREICKTIIQELKKIDNNWRNGDFKETSEQVIDDLDNGTIGKNCIAFFHPYHECRFFYRTSLQMKNCIYSSFESISMCNTEIVVVWDEKNVKILDTDGHLISEAPELDEDERISWDVVLCCISGDQMAVISNTKTHRKEKLSLWHVTGPSEVIRLKSRLFNCPLLPENLYELHMDKQFIAVFYLDSKSTHIYFFSKKTLDLYWQKTIVINLNSFTVPSYGQGILLSYDVKQSESEKFGLIEMYDVTSGTCFREIRTKVKHCYVPLDYLVGFNSKFMVISKFGEYRFGSYQMDVYDLAAVKNPIAEKILLYTLDVDMFRQLMVSEIEIICFGRRTIYRVDFSTLENLGDEEKSIFALPKFQAE